MMLLMELFHPSTFKIKKNENMPHLGLTLQGHSQGPRVPKTISRENHLPKAIFLFECYQ